MAVLGCWRHSSKRTYKSSVRRPCGLSATYLHYELQKAFIPTGLEQTSVRRFFPRLPSLQAAAALRTSADNEADDDLEGAGVGTVQCAQRSPARSTQLTDSDADADGEETQLPGAEVLEDELVGSGDGAEAMEDEQLGSGDGAEALEEELLGSGDGAE
ncbi:hypothetical protein CYMTET_26431 [Cymbomonas tetramitiformis]|uniref:Uncharacterized protein n=1 Tax=Cymbomonas tetramitiformis TaxID=36881 RepID=A0AAE0KY21_9CHLO|nr:hypothetical protein CYMTET_26431 [Cymbomonas tetramitiformis]